MKHLAPTLTAMMLCLLANAQARTDSGGTGTIDPSTVAANEVVHDGTLVRNTSEAVGKARLLGTDAGGNFYIGTVIFQRSTSPGGYSGYTRSATSKYSPAGALLWRHEGTTGNDFRDPSAPAADAYHDVQVSLEGLSVDRAGNVVAGFNVLSSATAYPYTPSPANTLLVGYNADGQVRWRDFTGRDATTTPNPTTTLQSIATTPDGGALALLSNSSSDPYNTVIVVRLAGDGTERFSAVFGTNTDGLDVLPRDLTDDGTGNAYLLTREDRRATGNPGLLGVGYNAIRRIGPSGTVLSQFNASVADSTQDAWVQAKTDSSGRLYIGGQYSRHNTSSTSNDADGRQLLLAYDLDLSQRWRALVQQWRTRPGHCPKR